MNLDPLVSSWQDADQFLPKLNGFNKINWTYEKRIYICDEHVKIFYDKEMLYTLSRVHIDAQTNCKELYDGI